MECKHIFNDVEVTPEVLAELRLLGAGVIDVDDEISPDSDGYGIFIDGYEDGEPYGQVFTGVERCVHCGAYRVYQSGDDYVAILQPIEE